jgi:hypothetical protein
MVLLQGLNNVDALKRLKLECLNCSMDGTRLLVSRYSACHLTGCGIKFDLQYNFFLQSMQDNSCEHLPYVLTAID